ncbi:MAG: hypothetical protein LJE95_07645 [Acidobacteria bacterium]|jgi:hypothetical protein|nr:hypothetical protein [Acidobacteriota bacterium]
MATYVEVTITYQSGVVKCSPDTVELHFNSPQGPDSVRWILSTGTSSLQPVFTWNQGCPFATMRDDLTHREVVGTDNKKVAGDYPYTVTLTNPQGQAVAGVDPAIRNHN